ncbi:MAG: Stk1 family PASTA domain-containing Ser/Thr kinase [Peptococcaceae bacterium]|nr:Stk1 family PASTA domain-containing Ser/Thr kinase [Peptococcaceae bacterium]
MEDKRILAGRYELIQKIGTGGMAVVYQAYDTALDRQVAVKVLRDEYIDNPDFIRQFQREAKAVAKLSHQNIVNIYDFGTSDGWMYLVMEYVEGCTLKELIAKNGPLPIQQIVDYSIQICYGMAQAHSHNIVHKDIKPHNIMVDYNHIAKITDFGIAQAVNHLTMTHSNGVLGSAHYFSPEQARGEQVEFESDIYSLGIVMYEMLTGKVPFTGDNPVSVALKHMQDKPPSLRVARRDIPLELELVVLRALEKHPSDRFQSMEEMAEALLQVQAVLDDQGAGIAAYAEVGVSRHAEAYQQYIADRAGQGEVEVRRASRKSVEYAPDDDHTRIMTSMEETRNQKYQMDERYAKEPERRVKKRNILLLVAGALLLFFGSFWAVTALMGNDEVQVPNLADKTVIEAEKLLSAQSLELVVSDEIYSKDVAKGDIISQKPAADSTVKKGREIQVVVSLGIEKILVPDLKGMNQQQYQVALENAGLILGETSMVTDKEQPYDVVVYQTPEANTEVEPGTLVNIMINQPPEASVPSLVGKTQAEAQQALQAAGLEIGGITTEGSKDYVKGIVLRQDPQAGASLNEGMMVNLVISNGPGLEQSAQFELIVPESGTITAALQDANGTTELYREQCRAGERVQKAFIYYGTANLTITCNGKVIMEKVYES